jgi:hypothetical protein
MLYQEQVVSAIYDAIDTVNETLDRERRLPRSPDAVIAGESATLDSVVFATLVVAIEENIERAFQRNISIMDAMAESERGSWTVGSLAGWISERLFSAAPAYSAPPAQWA